MAASAGRQTTLTWGAAAIGGVREKAVALNGEPIDVSSDDDAGWRALLTIAGENQVNVSLSGVTKADALRADWFAGTRTKEAIITFQDGGIITGNFMLVTYNETAPYKDALTFECELQSTGAVVYTPAA